MPSALPVPASAAAFGEWTWQPLALILAVAATLWYLRAVRRVPGWPWRRSAIFLLGVALLVWVTCGFFGAYSSSLYWAWTSRELLVWLVVPALLLAGKPLHLAAAISADGRLQRVLRSRPVRVFGHPLVAPATVPILSALLFFGPVPSWTVQAPAFAWLLDVILLVLGLAALAPLLGPDDNSGGLAVAAALLVGMVELILDAIPGIVLRLQTHLASGYWTFADKQPWTPSHLHDQQLGGSILWVVAEVIDLPFLVLAFRRWLRADARDAAEIDVVLEAERAARASLPPLDQSETGQPAGEAPSWPGDAPWWLSDPQMQRRLHRDS